MKAKLTLNIDPGLIAKAKQYAKAHNTTISKLVEDFFKRLIAMNQTDLDDKPLC